MKYNVLGRTGLQVSRLGLGGAPLAGDFGKTDTREIQHMIHGALDTGINFIDTAPKYGNGESERRIGQALRGRRNGVILATKAAKSDEIYTYEVIYQSVETSLRLLQTDWIDLIQLHDVESQSYDGVMQEALPALLKLQEEGKIRYIGVTTRNLPLLKRYMQTGMFDTIQFYTRYMLIDHTAKDEVIPLAKQLDIGVINGSVLGLGLLADKPAPFLNEEIKNKAQSRMEQIAFLRQGDNGGLIEPGMRFSLGNPDIHVTLTGADSPEVLQMNAAYCDGKALDTHDMRKIYELFDKDPLFT
ncbi:aldo/keto reductase [Paenibacillus roseipurpureus]|uniref:Aldo/keto reductase n=1 Tax=Paenibacillus roseopurpureus TaxID=2918901 RepID=A0AA96RLI1_9BACL|nr:aldo/keto reductase [Paenibacillus sp. MBLB1832]WNR45411.1 aldo/keto reductase [Paenibacillus sp. MBLB1832]